MEQSRALLEQAGIKIAAISYDSAEILKKFAELNRIGYPLLSDQGSTVIRRFGIFNENLLPDMRAYGVPHPVEYLLAPDGTVREKFFVPNYQHRVAGSEVAMRAQGTAGANAIHLKSGHVEIVIGLSSREAFAGQELGLIAEFSIAPGWHIYGAPAPAGYTSTAVRFETHHVAGYSFKFPSPQVKRFEALGETIAVHYGNFKAVGRVLLKFPLQPADYTLAGTIDLQQCSDTECEGPQIIRFQLPIKIAPTVPEPKRS